MAFTKANNLSQVNAHTIDPPSPTNANAAMTTVAPEAEAEADAYRLRLNYDVVGSSKEVVFSTAAPTAREITQTFEEAVGGSATMWNTYFEMPVPDKYSYKRTLSVSKSTTHVASVMLFFSWCTQQNAFDTGVSVFVRGRETPLMPDEPLRIDQLGDTIVTVLPETTIPELTDAITELCLNIIPDVIERKIAINAQQNTIRRLKKTTTADKVGTNEAAVETAEASLCSLKESLAQAYPSFIVALVNSTVVARAQSQGVACVVEQLRRFFMLLTRETKHCAARNQRERLDEFAKEETKYEERWGSDAIKLFRSGMYWTSHYAQLMASLTQQDGFRTDLRRMQYARAALSKVSQDAALALLQEAYEWTTTYDNDGGSLFKSKTERSDGQIKTVLKCMLYVIEKKRAVEEMERRRAYVEERDARLLEKRRSVYAKKCALAKSGAAKYRRRGDAAALLVSELKALGAVQFGVELSGCKGDLVVALTKLITNAAWTGQLTIDEASRSSDDSSSDSDSD